MADQGQQHPRRQRTFRPRRDIFEGYNDAELIKRFRLDHAGIVTMADLVVDRLQSRTERNRPLNPETKVAITLRYLATGEMQQCSCDDFGTTHPTINPVITQTIDALSHPDFVRQYVKFPCTRQEVQRKQEEFMEISGFVVVVAAIDGTHTRIVAPTVNEHLYINRKRYHSINVQVVCDAKYRLLGILARWPGSVHDARILDESGLKGLFERNEVPRGCYMLGDSSYPCKNWLLTPYLNHLPGPQANYNRFHKTACCVVKKTIGQLKRRFHVLYGEVRLSPEKTCKIVYACALLHNICKQRNLPLPNDEEEVAHPYADGEVDPNPPRPTAHNGHPFRDCIANFHFSVDE
ncbi:putative nuclease HARBI1 [Scylla paramamosain]|uniref:putative nuclease HARBI1 n=1 Tax=Scylla paramamosain TaxID=85552 RepID=UPI003082B9AF